MKVLHKSHSVIASIAKQSHDLQTFDMIRLLRHLVPRKDLDCHVASAPRNDGEPIVQRFNIEYLFDIPGAWVCIVDRIQEVFLFSYKAIVSKLS
jgi:hypothetical protein